MKKILLILLLPLLCACEKEDIETIDAPALPTNALYWNMPLDKVIAAMQNAGYVILNSTSSSGKKIFVHNSDNNSFWEIPNTDHLSSLIYHYCGSDREWARYFWANIVGLGAKYERGLISWNTVCKTPITTSNTVITIDGAKYRNIKINKLNFTSSVTAVYTKK